MTKKKLSARGIDRVNKYGEEIGRRVFFELNRCIVAQFDVEFQAEPQGFEQMIRPAAAGLNAAQRREVVGAIVDDPDGLNDVTLATFQRLCYEIQTRLDFGLSTEEELI